MGSVEEPLHVMIVGAGSAGLLIAQGLKKVGISCTVFEQSESPTARPRDWNFGIYWAQDPLGECLPPEISERMIEVQVDDHTPAADDKLHVWNGLTGELLQAFPTPYNLRLRRKAFIELVSEGIDIRYGKRLANFSTSGDKVTATFEDDSEYTANLIIGADGAHSVVRDVLLGPEKAVLHPSPIVASATLTRLPTDAALQLRALCPRYSCSFHPNGWFTWMGLHNAHLPDPQSWEWMIIQSWPQSEPTTLVGPEILANMKLRANHFFEPYRSATLAIPDDAKAWHNRLSYWPTEPWDDAGGRVTLVGDAAHAMTFHRGQGMNNAVLDACSLVHAIRAMPSQTPSALAAAVAEYQTDVWERGRAAVLSQNENSEAIHDWETLMQSPLFKSGLQRIEK